MKTLKLLSYSLLICFLLSSCGTSFYDQYSFTETLETKANALSLVEVSDQEYQQHKVAAQALINKIDMMVSYEKAKSKNEITIQMWQYLQSDASSIQQFLDLWETQGTLSSDFKAEFKPQVAKIFDLMANYENKKNEQSKLALLDLITM